MEKNVKIENYDIFFEKIKNNNNYDAEYYINYLQLVKLLKEAKKRGIKLYYMYNIISCLDNFKINKKSISCKDAFENTIYFKEKNNYNFYLCLFRIKKEED